MDIKYNDLKNSLRMIREFKGMTQKQLCQETKLSQSVVSYVEMSEGNSTLDTVKRICDALGYDLRFKLIPKKTKNNKIDNQLNMLNND